ncbi:hypothetical protein LCGC14_0209100 [marine sediment metagenome]|uniref:Uncharacterized protein n=1 Tax=marine sediment metagenome TaxID=412755 RepID=A0A0F9ULB1_9ZZZZ
MSLGQTAARRTDSQYAASGTMTVATGAPVKVYCVELAADISNATVFTIYDGDGTTVRGKVHLAANTSLSWGCCHIADKGIAVNSDKAAASCTVFHDSPGN